MFSSQVISFPLSFRVRVSDLIRGNEVVKEHKTEFDDSIKPLYN